MLRILTRGLSLDCQKFACGVHREGVRRFARILVFASSSTENGAVGWPRHLPSNSKACFSRGIPSYEQVKNPRTWSSANFCQPRCLYWTACTRSWKGRNPVSGSTCTTTMLKGMPAISEKPAHRGFPGRATECRTKGRAPSSNDPYLIENVRREERLQHAFVCRANRQRIALKCRRSSRL